RDRNLFVLLVRETHGRGQRERRAGGPGRWVAQRDHAAPEVHVRLLVGSASREQQRPEQPLKGSHHRFCLLVTSTPRPSTRRMWRPIACLPRVSGGDNSATHKKLSTNSAVSSGYGSSSSPDFTPWRRMRAIAFASLRRLFARGP